MQPQDQILASVSSTTFSWISTEITSVLQLLFFLALGYTVTRSWIWSKSRSQKAHSKKIDDIDHVLEEIQGTSCSESDATPANKSKARLSNATERKNKKAKEARKKGECSKDFESAVPEPVPVLLEELPQEQPPEQHAEEQSAPEAEVDSPPEAPQTLIEESSTPETPAPVSERVTKMLAKKAERKAKKAQEQLSAEEETAAEEAAVASDVQQPDKEPETEIVARVEAKSDAEALSDDMAQTLSTPSMTEVTPSNIQNDETTVESIPVVHKEVTVQDSSPMIRKIAAGSSDTLDNMETDAQSDSDEVHSSQLEGISTPEQCLTPRALNVDPMMWCGAGVPQIEGWVAVAVPVEYAPPGAPGPFDGLWKNQADERIVIDHEEILFESGMKWVMEMQSLTSLSVKLGDEVFSAEMDPVTQQLRWSDGDIWACVGQTDAQQQWAAARGAEGMPCVLLDGEQYMSPMMSMNPMMSMESMQAVQTIPEDAKTWEICWDWSKKGWCPRADCDWYHPEQPQQQQQQWPNCQPCDSAPFVEYDVPFGGAGPIF